METTFQRQRKYPRFKAPMGLNVGWKSVGRRGVSRAAVLAMGGLFLQVRDPLPLWAVLELLFDLQNGEVRARAIVRDSTPGKGMGVQFVQMQSADRARLNQFLSQYAAAQSEPIQKSSS